MQIIRVTKGQEHNVRIIEKPQKDALFFDVYVRAKNIADEIVKESEMINSFNNNPDTIETINNIILFNGSRGQGKTSAMRSFDRMLENDNWEKLEMAQKNTRDKVSFHSLRVIEPSMLNSKESILRVFLSELFWFFKKKIAKNDECKKHTICNKNAILLQFGQCFDSINFIENPDYGISEQDDLDELLKLGRATELRKDLYKLIRDIKAYCFDNDAHYFVVMIDDADLSVKNAYDICEDVREYLTIPGILVLMAADFEQLKYAVLQKYLKNYEVLTKHSESYNMSEICSEMEWRYLEKLFPIDHRIQLPEINSLDLSRVMLEYLKSDEKKEQNLLSAYTSCINLQQIFSQMIFQKTGMIFIAHKATMRALLPKSMRELVHFLKILDSMEVIQYENVYKSYNKEDKTQLELAKKNINIFKQYFVHNWCNANIEASQCKYIREILETKDLKIICSKLKAIIKDSEQLQKQSSSDEGPKFEIEQIINILDITKTSNVLEREAVLILLTILLNELFLRCIEEHSFNELRAITDYFFSKMHNTQIQQQISLNEDLSYQSNISVSIYDEVKKGDSKSIVDNKLFEAFFRSPENDPNGNRQFSIWHMLYYMIDLADNKENLETYYYRDDMKAEGLGTKENLTMDVSSNNNSCVNIDFGYLILLQRVFANTDCLAEKCFTPVNEEEKISIEDLHDEIYSRFKMLYKIDEDKIYSYSHISNDTIKEFVKDILGDKEKFKDSLEAILCLNETNFSNHVKFVEDAVDKLEQRVNEINPATPRQESQDTTQGTQDLRVQIAMPELKNIHTQLEKFRIKDLYNVSKDDSFANRLTMLNNKITSLCNTIESITSAPNN